MDEIEILNSGIIVTKEFGEMKIQTILIYYDYPRCFIAKNQSDYFAFLENDESSEKFGWNVTRVTLKDINEVNIGEKDMQSLFSKPEKYIFKNVKNKIICNKVAEFSGKNEIKGSLYIKDFCDMDELFDYHKLKQTSKMHNESSISIIYENNSDSNTGLFFKTVSYLKECCKWLKSPIDILQSNFSVQNASTVFTFEFPNTNNGLFVDDNNFEDTNSNGIRQLGNIFNSNEPEQILNEISDIKSLQKFDKLAEIMALQTKSRPKVVISTPKNEHPVVFKFDKTKSKEASKLVCEAKKIHDSNLHIDTIEKKYEGILTGILTEGKNRFSFRPSGMSEAINGTVDFSLIGNKDSYLVNAVIYEAIIKETTVLEKGNVKKIVYQLCSLKVLRELDRYNQIDLNF